MYQPQQNVNTTEQQPSTVYVHPDPKQPSETANQQEMQPMTIQHDLPPAYPSIAQDITEHFIKPINGGIMCLVLWLLLLAGIAMIVVFAIYWWFGIFIGIACLIVAVFLIQGFVTNQPNNGRVYLLCGKYYGTLIKAGFFWVNPFTSTHRSFSLKATTLENSKLKVNDILGNPIEIGVIVVYRIVNTAKAAFSVSDSAYYLSTVSDSAIRNVARQYPYDVSDEGEEMSLRGSGVQIAIQLQKEIQERVEIAGIEVLEARISQLSYAHEIAAAMLQRQQAVAVVAARQKIVEGAVGMVHMALAQIEDEGKIVFTPDRKAQMVANLLVVLCGGRDAQPTLNVGES
ncbi:putative sPFH domain/band 7 family protein [Blattamonas nauphoetae]|uniref:SPFH domain/band 7 family protein n=1 Tax=Blattamonas nauphoetae TaxID=2049346 RepID=A0ABQ9XS94_9EUKA|nr:putative sPFH domain/band 7 family protein [Blattamonas nauphoetae]